jgi:hypothetical protein
MEGFLVPDAKHFNADECLSDIKLRYAYEEAPNQYVTKKRQALSQASGKKQPLEEEKEPQSFASS